MNRLPRIVLGITALIGFILALAVHFTALAGVDIASHIRGVWLLHLGIFLVFVPFIFYARHDLGSQPTLSLVAATLPRWAAAVGAIIFAYTVANFLIFIAGTEGGSTAIRDGKYLLLNHGTLIRELSAAEYSAFQANVIRGFSGHWLVFFFVPAAYFLLGPKSKL